MPANIDYAKHIFDCVTAACGGCCCICRVNDGRKLVCGHLDRAKDGGPATMPNIMPICKSCNGKFKGGPTPDERPDEWFDRFIEILRAGGPARKDSKQVDVRSAPQNIERVVIKSPPGTA